MRKLKLQVQMSLDGFVAGANGEMDWMTFDWDERLKKVIDEITAPVDLILMGRKMIGGFIEAWSSRMNSEAATDARKFLDTPKVIFSKTVEESVWANSTMAKNNLAEEISQLKNQTGGDIIAYGGANFVSSLIKENRIDEYNLFINPVILGKGLAIFDQAKNRLNLRLIESENFDCGIVLLRYEPQR